MQHLHLSCFRRCVWDDPGVGATRGSSASFYWKWHRAGVSRRTIATRLGKRPGSVLDAIRDAGGIPPRLRVRSPHHLSLEDRQGIERALARGDSYRTIARWIGCAPSTVAREVARPPLSGDSVHANHGNLVIVGFK